MKTEPWLSVLMPIFNGEKYLTHALDSIIAQWDPNIECIAVDGESTDATLSILNSYEDRLQIRVLQQERNSGWVAKTNYALAHARGEYVCFLHHDDLWLNDRLKTMKNLTEQFPEVDLLLHSSFFLDQDGNKLGLWRCPLPSIPQIITSSLMTERLLVQNFISIVAPVFRREAALKAGGLDEGLWYTADWDFWLKMAAGGDTLYCPTPLSGYRVHPSSQTTLGSSHAGDFRYQLERVANKYFESWEAPELQKQRVRTVADFSIEVNVALAGVTHGQKAGFISLLLSLLLLGPGGWYRYLRDSRIWERGSARLKAQIRSSSQASIKVA